MNLRKKIKDSDTILFKTMKKLYYATKRFSIPAPRILSYPLWQSLNVIRNVYYWVIRVFIVTPVFKGLCDKVGRNFTAGTFLPFTMGVSASGKS